MAILCLNVWTRVKCRSDYVLFLVSFFRSYFHSRCSCYMLPFLANKDEYNNSSISRPPWVTGNKIESPPQPRSTSLGLRRTFVRPPALLRLCTDLRQSPLFNCMLAKSETAVNTLSKTCNRRKLLAGGGDRVSQHVVCLTMSDSSFTVATLTTRRVVTCNLSAFTK